MKKYGYISGLCFLLCPMLLSCQKSAERTSLQHIQESLQPIPLPVAVRSTLIPDPEPLSVAQFPSSERRLDIMADQVQARVFFLSLVEGLPYNIAIHPKVEGKISLTLKNVTLKQVLDTVRNVYGFDYRVSDRGIEILPATLQTRSFPVHYLDINRGGQSEISVAAGGLKRTTSAASSPTTGTASATTNETSVENTPNSKITTRTTANFWGELKETIQALIGEGEGRKVAISPLAGLLVVQAMPAELRKVDEFLKSAAISLNRQVILEAKIIEVELSSGFQSGINWSFLSGKLQAMQQRGSSQATAGVDTMLGALPMQISSSLSTAVPAGTPNFPPLGGIFSLATNYKNLSTFVELLETQGKVHVLSSPRVSTTNNQKALIKVGRDQFYVTNVSTTTTTTGTTTTNQPNIEFTPFFSGIALDVTPHINDEDEITLHIHPSVVTVETQDFTINLGTSNGGQQTYPLAASDIRESDNMVRAKNGEMVVIGGLMKDQTGTIKTGIPFLKDLPVLGKLFTQTVHQSVKSELVIVLRPVIVDAKQWSEQLEGSLDFINRIDRGL